MALSKIRVPNLSTTGNFGKPLQHFSENNIYVDLGFIKVGDLLKYGVGEKLDYTKLSAEQLKASPKVIIKKLENPGQIEFRFQLKKLRKADQEAAKNQFFDMVYDDYRSSMLHGIRLIKRLLNENGPRIRKVDPEIWWITLRENERQLNIVHNKYTNRTAPKESLILHLDIVDYTAKNIWCGMQFVLQTGDGQAIVIRPAEQPSTSRWNCT